MILQDYLWKIFPPYEGKVTKAHINEFFEKHASDVGLMSGDTVQYVKNLALNRIKNHRAVVHSVRIEHIHPEHIALIQIVNAIDSHLGSGECHIYRNTLREDGKDLLSILSKANKILVEKKYMTQENINKLDAELRAQIARAG